ncbi:ion channel [Cellulosimicrobium marinum]|uniref:ion channel n=1 Tax=Cellulosimicrobium marinum TaxID=1638992 RepID=UPI001E4EFE8F|nr:ion channel [Cellulosimicrobium marinum]MCB7135954.1 hypothetical protein [Cellulosimicrobium marinum]
MDVALTLAGTALVVLVLRDVFHTLWHPAGEGRLNGLVGRAAWAVVHRLPARSRARRLLMDLAGPWCSPRSSCSGPGVSSSPGGLVFWPHMPSGFDDTTGPPPVTVGERLVSTGYVSMVGLSTLGIGDIVPTTPWTRTWTAVQAIVGFALLSASMSWVLQVSPALTRRRALARRLTALARSTVPSDGPAGRATAVPVSTLEDLVQQVAAVHVELRHYGETYYFRDSVADEALPAAVGIGADLADGALRSPDPEVRRSAASLGWALARYAALLDERYLHTDGSTREILAAYAADQDHEPTPHGTAPTPSWPEGP